MQYFTSYEIMILGAAEDLSKILARSEEIASDEGRKKYKVHPAYGLTNQYKTQEAVFIINFSGSCVAVASYS